VADLLTARRAEIAYNPNDCVETRWAPRRARRGVDLPASHARDQQARMAQVRRGSTTPSGRAGSPSEPESDKFAH